MSWSQQLYFAQTQTANSLGFLVRALCRVHLGLSAAG